MSNLPPWIFSIENLSRGLPVLLVEGEEDVQVFRYFLTQHSPGWETRFYIAAAGAKRLVVRGVTKYHPDWIGIIDQDEWNPDDIAAIASTTNRIRVLPRFCIESYFCWPWEFWDALPENQRQRLNNDLNEIHQPVFEVLGEWVAHGAMWRIIQKLKQHPGLLRKLESEPVTDEVKIREILENWRNQLVPETVLERYHQELDRGLALNVYDQMTNYVHGKKFFNKVIVQVLDQKLSGKGKGDWMQKFFDGNMQAPDDMKAILDWVISNL